ncbi:ankyrin, partial [Glonium stellatum]
PLHYAARDDSLVLVKKLIDRGVDINYGTVDYRQTPLHIAAYYGAYEVANELLQRGANTEVEHKLGAVHEYEWDGLTPIAFAASKHRTEMVKLLLDAGASPYARPQTKHTLIHFATTERTPAMLGSLLNIEKLQDPSVIDARASNGVTALHLCVGNLGRHEHLKLLLDYGAD